MPSSKEPHLAREPLFPDPGSKAKPLVDDGLFTKSNRYNLDWQKISSNPTVCRPSLCPKSEVSVCFSRSEYFLVAALGVTFVIIKNNFSSRS